ncbi:MAG: hypothetical protein AAFO82_19230 [Bacteroidota bacterium]
MNINKRRMERTSKLESVLIGNWNFTQYYPETHIILTKRKEEFGSIYFETNKFKCRPYNEADAKIFGKDIEKNVAFEGFWSIENENILSLRFCYNIWSGRIDIYEATAYILIEIIKDTRKI